MIIYAAMYCPCIHESEYGIISIHTTIDGAQAAVDRHKNTQLVKFNDMFTKEEKKRHKFGEMEDWKVQKFEATP